MGSSRRLAAGWLRTILAACIVALASPPAAAAQFTRATFEGRSQQPGCGEGGFADLAGQCWQCPPGFKHDNFLLPPQHERVCRAGAQFSTGIKQGQAVAGCPPGQWPSMHNGHCYTCPAGYRQDVLFHGDDARVCFQPQEARIDYAKGIRQGRAVLGLGCPAGQWPSTHNGLCYTCPAGFDHDSTRIGDDPRVCLRRSGGDMLRSKGIMHAKVNVGVCPAGQWVSVHDAGCYTCPAGYAHDSGRAGNDPAVCARRQELFSRAAGAGSLLCARGFFDPVRGGSCWSCPGNARVRTVAPVEGDRACTDDLASIVAVDVCRPLVSALREGEKGLQGVQEVLRTLAGPVLQPLNQAVTQVTSNLQAPRELDALLEKLGQPLRPHLRQLEDLQRLQAQLDRSGAALRDALLDPELVCGGDIRALDRRLAQLGVQPRLAEHRNRWFAQLPIGQAHAAERTGFGAFSVALYLGQTGFPINTVALTAVTNLQGRGGWFLSIGRTFSGSPLGDLSVGAMLFPSASIDNFDGLQSLGAEIALDIESVVKLLPFGAKLPQGVSVSFDPLFQPQSGLGIGVSKTVANDPRSGLGRWSNPPQGLRLGFTSDWTFKLR